MTRRCPITYETIPAGQKYSLAGLKKLSPRLTHLDDIQYSAEEQRQEALERATKLSIQGVQPKLSARLDIAKEQFLFVDRFGTFIIKPQNQFYSHLPENEDLTMRLAASCGIETPLHGLIYCKDGSLSYFIKRFDRLGRKKKVPMEDFAQLSGRSRETKYDFSTEKLIKIIDQFTTFPALERRKLFQRLLFCFLTGNEDMHLKNFSLITREGISGLSPGYDLLNTTIALKNPREEMALPIKGKKRKLVAGDFLEYLAVQQLELQPKVIRQILQRVHDQIGLWKKMIHSSFMSESHKKAYLELLQERIARIWS